MPEHATVGPTSSAPLPGVSVIVPTFRERDNLPELIDRVGRVRDAFPDRAIDLHIVDDDSNDGTEAYIDSRKIEWVFLTVRKNERGLSSAVIEGIRVSRREIIVVMDGDMSHPPERIPRLVELLHAGHDFVVGSRFIKGGSTQKGWGLFRQFNSFVATSLARPITSISDPMSGFFGFRRSAAVGRDLNPVGYKIGLELIVKCGFNKIAEIPIDFANRTRGSSKLTVKQQLLYIEHLRRLYLFKLGIRS